jgi:hypothetical protein
MLTPPTLLKMSGWRLVRICDFILSYYLSPYTFQLAHNHLK